MKGIKFDLKLFRLKKIFRKGGLHIDPNVCWDYILFGSFLLIASSFALGLYLFFEVNKQDSLPANTSGLSERISKERIDSTLEYFNMKRDRTLEIIASPSPI